MDLYRTRAGGDPQEPEFGLEVVTHVLATMIMPDLQADRDPGRESPKLPSDSLPERLQGLEARGGLRRMDADTFEGAMIHAHECQRT